LLPVSAMSTPFEASKLDRYDRLLLAEIQRNANIAQSELGARVS